MTLGYSAVIGSSCHMLGEFGTKFSWKIKNARKSCLGCGTECHAFSALMDPMCMARWTTRELGYQIHYLRTVWCMYLINSKHAFTRCLPMITRLHLHGCIYKVAFTRLLLQGCIYKVAFTRLHLQGCIYKVAFKRLHCLPMIPSTSSLGHEVHYQHSAPQLY